MNHDIVVIGASAGGVNALQVLLSRLPAGLPASVFITIHTTVDSPGYLAEVLGRVCPLPVVYASMREDIERGKIYLSRSNLHLIIKRGQVACRFLAKENGTRPAIDPMFRTAAHSYGRRVIGVILTGNLDDGVAGLGIIKDEGGIVVVQDPKDAQYNNMPTNALRYVKVDHVVPLAEMAPLLVGLVNSRVEGEPVEEVESREGDQVLSCPNCGGVLRQYVNSNVVWYKCQVGHRFTPEAMAMERDGKIEDHLWTTVALLKQKAEVDKTMASDARTSNKGTPTDPQYFEKQAQTAEQLADTIETFLEQKGPQLFPGPPEKSPEKLQKTKAKKSDLARQTERGRLKTSRGGSKEHGQPNN